MHIKRVLIYMLSTIMMTTLLVPVTIATEVDQPQAQTGSANQIDRDKYVQRMNSLSAFMESLREHLDRAAFDVDELALSLDYDPDMIIDFSKSAIAFEQYPGVLRGAHGTLLSRAGNSIDQALLLARLLRDSGFDARIAGTKLDAVGAVAVLQALKQPVKPPPPFGDAEAIMNLLEQSDLFGLSLNEEQRRAYSEFVNAPSSPKNANVYQRVEATTDFIISHLEKAGVNLSDSGGTAVLLEEAQEYYWVQYRKETAGSWDDVHPIFVDEPPFESLEVETYITESVPEKLLHKLRFQVFIERKTGEKLEVVPITGAWEHPIANLVGLPLTFSNMSNEMLDIASIRRDLEDLLTSASYFVPTFGSSMARGASYFDLHGRLIDPMAAQSAGAALFSTLGDAFSDSIAKFGDESAIPTLTAQWMEFTLIPPEGEEQIFRRVTFDRIGSDARESGNLPVDLKPTTLEDVRTLMQRHTFMIASGSVPRGYVLESGISRLETARPGIDALMDLQVGKGVSAAKLDQIPVGWSDHLALFTIFDLADTLSSDHRSYRSGPALVMHSDGLGRNDKWVESIDIVTNPRRSVDVRVDVPRLDAAHAVKAGVWETAVEGIFLENGERFDTWRAFAANERAGVKPVVLVPRQPRPKIDLPADTLAAIDLDLERGYAVIVSGSDGPTEGTGWWRTSLHTGETLGQIRDGRGQSATEQVILMIISAGALTYSLKACTDAVDTSSDLLGGVCCVAVNVGMSFGFAGALGLAFAKVAGTVSLRVTASALSDAAGVATPAAEICGL